MFYLKLKIHRIIAVLIVCIFLIQITNAGYTSEEIDENSKSLYKAETSILASTENNKHQHRRTYSGPPCVSGGCSGVSSPCASPMGCSQPAGAVYNNGIGYSVNPAPTTVANGYGGGYSTGHTNLPPAPYMGTPAYTQPIPYQGSTGIYGPPVHNGQPSTTNGAAYRSPSLPQPSHSGYASAGYSQPGVVPPAPYAHWNSHPSHYGYQGPRGYSVYDHSLKLNTEYTEVGTHTGPLQQSGSGYGSGFGGGYNGLFNRPGF